MVGERRRHGAAKGACQRELVGRGVDQILATDHQVHILPLVVDDHAQAVGPVAVSIADRQVTAQCHGAAAWPEQGVVPALIRPGERDPERRSVEPAGPAIARTAGAPPRPTRPRAPGRERRPRAGTAVHQAVASKLLERSFVRPDAVGVGLADRPGIRREVQPCQIFDQGRVVLGPRPLAIVILDTHEDVAAVDRGQPPHEDRVRDVPRCR